MSRKVTEVGTITMKSPITVAREIEVGQAWEATSEAHNHAALGGTPKEAVKNLLSALNKRGLSFQAHADEKKMARLAVSGNEEETG